MKYLTGIGSRSTPKEYANTIETLSQEFVSLGYVLRSGGREGSDTMWESAFDKFNGNKEIYLPWKGFNNNSSKLYSQPIEAFHMAEHTHPRWDKLSLAVKKLHARNVLQILGQELQNKSMLVICYTLDGCESGKSRSPLTGGTGTAIELASSLDIPVFNLKNSNCLDRIKQFLSLEY